MEIMCFLIQQTAVVCAINPRDVLKGEIDGMIFKI